MSEQDIHSVTDARRYREELSLRAPENEGAAQRWRTCERCVLMIIAAIVFLGYYMISVNLEILKLPQVSVSAAVVSHPQPRPASADAS